jgi:hypothetical protein
MQKLDWLRGKKQVVAMIHVGALPGTPRASEDPIALQDRACREAQMYEAAGVDALMLENMHDVPYMRATVGPEIVASMTAVACAVRRSSSRPLGLQILAGAGREALAVALAAQLEFVRVEGFVFAHVADEGIIQACAGDMLRYRRAIGAEHVAVFADIKKKHCSHAITSDQDIVETAHAAEFFLADGVIVTGRATGEPAELDELARVKAAVKLPVLVGSGVTVDNVQEYLPHADALIVGSHFKESGHWAQPVDSERVKRFMDRVEELRAR